MEDVLARTENLENFSPGDFFKLGWETLDGKTAFFAPYFRGMVDDNWIMREALGPASHRMPFRDSRTGETREVLMLGSNNYLGLANEPSIVERTIEAVRAFGIGCGGPPLLNGTTTVHRALERKLAEMKKCEDAVVFASGYQANVGWTTGLLGQGDFLVYDAQNHASLFDGIKMGRFEAVPWEHNNVDELRRRLMHVRWKHPYTNVVVAVEGVYSMDGDVAPLPEVVALARKYGALVAVDDAHGTGVLGERGHGTPEHFGLEGDIDIVMGTFSKTFAVTGGFVAGKREMVDYLRFFARSYMFSANLPTPVAASVLAGIDFLGRHPERVRALHENVRSFVAGMRAAGFTVEAQTAIVPLFVPSHLRVRDLVGALFREGVFVNGVEFPAVPRDRQRLRISLMATFTKEDLDLAVAAFVKVGRQFGMLP